MESWLEQHNAALRSRSLKRTPRVRRLDDPPLIDLAANDYLGLSAHPDVVAAARDALAAWGTSSTASRVVSGTTAAHLSLEHALAAWCGAPTALVFSSGYLANVGVLTALAGPGTRLVLDAHAHASLVDGARRGRSDVVTVDHHDLDAVEQALVDRTQPRALIVVESIYSVLGDAAPLTELLALAERHDAYLLVDEAHTIGTRALGRGLVHERELAGHPRVIITLTLSKALASQGGAVLGSAALREYLVNHARTFMFDTALTPSACAAAEASLHVMAREPHRVERVRTVMAACAEAVGVPSTQVPAGPVLSVPMESPEVALQAASSCLEHGVAVGVFRPPSVPDGISRLRFTAHAGLSDAQLSHACRVLTQHVAPQVHRPVDAELPTTETTPAAVTSAAPRP